jgi:hypothetical protein
MTSPGGGNGGQNINLAALWIPVLPDTSKIGSEMEKSGAEAKVAWEKGFNSAGSSPEQVTRPYVEGLRNSLTSGLSGIEIPFGVSKLHEWLEQFSGDVDEKLVGKLKGEATQALQAYGAEHDKLAAAQDRLTESQNKLNLARDNGVNKASIMLPLLGEQSAATAVLEEQTRKTAAAHDVLTEKTGKLNEEQGKAVEGSQYFGAVMGGAVVVGVGLALEGVEKFVDFMKEGFEEAIDITKELGEKTLELGEKYEEIGLGIREFSGASGEAFEELEGRAQKVFGSLDVAGENTGQTFGQLTSILGEAIPDSLIKHVEELQGRFANLKAQDVAAIMYSFKVPAEETDSVLASLTQSARNAGQGVGDLVSAMKGDASEVLKQAGLDAQQAGAFIADMLKLGTGGRSVLGGLQTVMKEAAKGGQGFGDAMKYVGEHLKELGDTAEGQDYAEKVFGTRRWAVAMQAAQDYVDVIAKGPEAFDQSSDSLDQFLQQTETLENKWEEVKHKVEEAFMPLGMGALDLVDNLISGIKSKFEENIPEIRDEVKEIGDSFIDNLPAIKDFVAGGIEALGYLADFAKNVFISLGGAATGLAQIWTFVTGDQEGNVRFERLAESIDKMHDIDFKDMANRVATQIDGVSLNADDMRKKFDAMWDSARGEGQDQRSPGMDPPNPAANLTDAGGFPTPIPGAPAGVPGSLVGPFAGPYGLTSSQSATPVSPPGGGSVPGGGVFAGPYGNSGIYQDSSGKWHARDPWWEGVIQAESGGNIAPQGNPTHFGLFQFAQGTWDSIARQQNPAWVGKNPGTAPAAVQAQFAQQNYEQNKGNLYGQWANPFVAAHPNGASGPVWMSSGSGPGDDASPNPGAAVNAAGGLNLDTVAVAAQKFANDCIDASARIILSHSGVNMTEDQLEGVISPGTNIDTLASGLNQLDPQGAFRALPGSGGSQEAMFAAIKASIDSGTGSIANVSPGSSLAGHTFAPGHFIAVTGYNGDGTINMSDTAKGTKYTVSESDLYQATQGRGIVAGTGTGPAPVAGAGGVIGPSYGAIPGGRNGPAYPGLPGQYGGFGQYGGETADQQYSTAKAVREAQDRATDLDSDISKQQRRIQDIQDELSKGDPKSGKTTLTGGVAAETPEDAAAWADKQKQLNEQLSDATEQLTKTQRERSEQDGEIANAQRKQQEAMYKKPSGTGKSDNLGTSLGQGLLQGIGEELGLGTVFGKSPLDWGIVKLAEGLFNYGNSLGDAIFGNTGGMGIGTAGTPGGSQGLGGGMATGVLGSLGIKLPTAPISGAPNVVQNDMLPGQPVGALPGPAPQVVNNDNSIHVSSDVSDRAVMAPVQAQQNSSNSAAYQYQGGMPAQ